MKHRRERACHMYQLNSEEAMQDQLTMPKSQHNAVHNCLRLGYSIATASKGETTYSKLGSLKNSPWPSPTMAVVWDLETTELSIYHQEPMEIGYALLRVVKQGKASLNFERAGTTVSQLTLANVSPGAEAMNTHGITPEILRETGVPLDKALEALKNNIDAAKGKEQARVFF